MKTIDNKIVYESEDWVTVLEDSGGYTKGRAYKVRKMIGDVLYTEIDDVNSRTNGWHQTNFRPATQDEINSATKEEKIILKDDQGFNYDVKFNGAFPPVGGAFSIKVGCVEVSKETFLKIKKKAGW